jgi:hypothetical protein
MVETAMKTQYQSTDELVHAICADPSTSFWLKDALKTLLQRDAVDSAKDARLLADIMQSRLEELQEPYQRRFG